MNSLSGVAILLLEFGALRKAHLQLSVQEQSVLCVLDYPCQSCLQMLSRDCAASEDGPFMCLDCVELQSLKALVVLWPGWAEHWSFTFPISSTVMQPLTSVLLTKTSRLTPMSRYSLISLTQSAGQ